MELKIRITTVLCSFDTKMHHVSRCAKTDHTYISSLLTIGKNSSTRFVWKGFYIRVLMRTLAILIFFSRFFPSRPHPTPTEKNRKTTSSTPTTSPIHNASSDPTSPTPCNPLGIGPFLAVRSRNPLSLFLVLMLFLDFSFFFSVLGLSEAKRIGSSSRGEHAGTIPAAGGLKNTSSGSF